jgi:hypothetical protein
MNKKISELKNKHSGEDIWIILGGASMDYVSYSFFENKIVLGINQVYKHYPCNYILMKDCLEEPRFPRSIKQLDSLNIPLIFCEYYKGYQHYENCLWDPQGGEKNIVEHKNSYMFKHNPRSKSLIEELPTLGEDELIVSKSSVTSLLHLAAYMGASNIMLCGHDCGTLDNNLYYTDYTEKDWKSAGNWRGIGTWISRLEVESQMVRAFLMKRYGVNIHSLNPFLNLNLEGHEFKKL